jgi:hypothetical protein
MTLRRYTKIDRIISLFSTFGINRNHIRMEFAHIIYYFTVSSKQAETFQRHKANFFLGNRSLHAAGLRRRDSVFGIPAKTLLFLCR